MANTIEIVIGAKNTTVKAFKTLGLALGGIGVALGAIAKTTSSTGDQFQKMAQRIGVSAQALSELSFAATLSGSSIATVENGMRLLAKRMLDAQEGLAESERSFERLGIQVTDAAGNLRAVDEVFTDAIGAINKLGSETEKTALAQEIFGRSGTQLLPLIRAGEEGIAAMRKEAEILGLTFSQLEADQSAAFEDSLTRLGGVMRGLKNTIGKELIPTLTVLAEAIVATAKAPAEATDEILGAWVDVFNELISIVGKVSSVIWVPLNQAFEVMTSNIKFAWQIVVAEFLQILTTGAIKAAEVFNKIPLAPDIDLSGLKNFQKAIDEGILPVPKTIKEAVAESVEIIGINFKSVGENAKKITSILTETFAKLGLDLNLASEQTNQIIEDSTTKTTDSIKTKIFDFTAASAEAFNQMTVGIGNAVGQMIVAGESFSATMKNLFKSILSSFISMIVQMTVRWLVFQALTGGAFGGVGGGFAKAIGFAKGGVVGGGLNPVSAANGGVFTKPTLAVIGDNAARQEAVIPMAGGKVPVDLQGNGGGTIIINKVSMFEGASLDEALLSKDSNFWQKASRNILTSLNEIGRNGAKTNLKFSSSAIT